MASVRPWARSSDYLSGLASPGIDRVWDFIDTRIMPLFTEILLKPENSTTALVELNSSEFIVGPRPLRSVVANKPDKVPSPFGPPFGPLSCFDRMFHLVRFRGGYLHRPVLLRGRSHLEIHLWLRPNWAGPLRQAFGWFFRLPVCCELDDI